MISVHIRTSLRLCMFAASIAATMRMAMAQSSSVQPRIPTSPEARVTIPESLPIGSEAIVRTHMVRLINRVWVRLSASIEDFPMSGGHGAAVSAQWNMFSYGVTNVGDVGKQVFGSGWDETVWLERGKESAAAYLTDLTITQADFFKRHTNRVYRLSIGWLDREGIARSSNASRSAAGGPVFADFHDFWLHPDPRSGWRVSYYPRRPWSTLPPDPILMHTSIGDSINRALTMRFFPCSHRRLQHLFARPWLLDQVYLVTDGAYLKVRNAVAGVVQAVPRSRNDGWANLDGLLLLDLAHPRAGLFGPSNADLQTAQPVPASEQLLDIPLEYANGAYRGYLALQFSDGRIAFYDLSTGNRIPMEQEPSLEKPTTVSIKYHPVGILSYNTWYPKDGLPTVVEISGAPFSAFKLERSSDLRTWIEVKESDADLLEHLRDEMGWDRFSFRYPSKQPLQFFRAARR